METQSQDPAHRRHRGNRSGGRSRNRQGKQAKPETDAAGNGGRNRRRKRGGKGSSQTAKPTAAQKVLSILTFGLLGKPSPKSLPKPARRDAAAKSGASRKGAAPRSSGEEPKKTKRNRAEVTSGRLYVGNLDYSTGEAELEELFKGVGNVLRAEVVTNPRTQQSKGFAFVEMGSLEEAKRAVSILDDQEFMGRKLLVSGARGDGTGEDSGESAMAESAGESRG